ncbi:MAG: osmoprotectant NAGGN system M42 family peptidase [Desulfuromonadales bacterium]|jgi:peptidase M42 family hydrolase
MQRLNIDLDYLCKSLSRLLAIPSPTGFTDEIVEVTGQELERLKIPFELTRRGAIRAHLPGRVKNPDRAIVVHLDTTGAMVKRLKANGRLELMPIGHWSSRFAEGARVTLHTDSSTLRGTILPLKASGHTFNEEIDSQPVNWQQVELRVDAITHNDKDLQRLGIHVGDYVAIDPQPEFLDNGFIASRHLDNKAGVATLLAAARAIRHADMELPVDTHLLFTISEETGSGASAVLHRGAAELVTIDNGTAAPGQNSRESGVTVAMMDSSGPFDFHLTRKLLALCREYDILHQRDVFRHYRCDSASAVEAGNDTRTALICFGIDASHGYERTHLNALRSLAELTTLYLQSEPTFMKDEADLSNFRDFTQQVETFREHMELPKRRQKD